MVSKTSLGLYLSAAGDVGTVAVKLEIANQFGASVEQEFNLEVTR